MIEKPKYGIITREKKCAMSAKDDESPFFCYFFGQSFIQHRRCRLYAVL